MRSPGWEPREQARFSIGRIRVGFLDERELAILDLGTYGEDIAGIQDNLSKGMYDRARAVWVEHSRCEAQ